MGVAITAGGLDLSWNLELPTGDREDTFAAGLDHHLVKTVDTKKLSEILAAILNA